MVYGHSNGQALSSSPFSPRAPFLTYYLQSTELITTQGFYIASIIDKEAKLPFKS